MNETNPNEQTVPPAGSASGQATNTEYTFSQFVSDVCDVAVKAASAAGKAAEELSGLVVVPVDHEMRENLDVLVESGVSRNRAQALLYLARDGVKANPSVYSHVAETREQIKSLRNQLKSLVDQP